MEKVSSVRVLGSQNLTNDESDLLLEHTDIIIIEYDSLLSI